MNCCTCVQGRTIHLLSWQMYVQQKLLLSWQQVLANVWTMGKCRHLFLPPEEEITEGKGRKRGGQIIGPL